MNDSVIRVAVERALVNQPWYKRRKDTLTAIAGGILQVANIAAAYATEMPEWANVLIAALVVVAQVFVHAGTKGAITDSMSERLEEAALEEGVSPYITEVEPVPVLEVTHQDDPFNAGRYAAEVEGQAGQ